MRLAAVVLVVGFWATAPAQAETPIRCLTTGHFPEGHVAGSGIFEVSIAADERREPQVIGLAWRAEAARGVYGGAPVQLKIDYDQSQRTATEFSLFLRSDLAPVGGPDAAEWIMTVNGGEVLRTPYESCELHHRRDVVVWCSAQFARVKVDLRPEILRALTPGASFTLRLRTRQGRTLYEFDERLPSPDEWELLEDSWIPAMFTELTTDAGPCPPRLEVVLQPRQTVPANPGK